MTSPPVQELLSLNASTTFDLTFLSLIPWDLGSDEGLVSFFLDQGIITDPATVAVDCAAMRQQAQLLGLVGGGSDTTVAFGPLFNVVAQCLNATVERIASVDELNRELFCSSDRVRCLVVEPYHVIILLSPSSVHTPALYLFLTNSGA
jgi:hypothetical protein